MTKPLELANHIALKFHAGQKYGDEDYDYHLEQVFDAVWKATDGHDERLLAIAWMHDILEDTGCTVEVLQALFDKDIVKAVVALTFQFKGGGDYPDCRGESREQYLMRVKTSALAHTVKFHDTWCNLKESYGRQDFTRIKKYGNQLAFLAGT